MNPLRDRSVSLPRADGTPWLLGILAALLVSHLASPFLLSLVELTPAAAAAAARHALTPVALGNSLLTATIATAIVMLVGTPCAYLLARHTFSGKRALMVFAYVVLLLPPLVGGVVLLGVVGAHTLIGGWLATRGVYVTAWWLVLAAQACVSAPYLLITGRVAFEALDPSLEHVSLTLGKPPLITFLRVSLPLARPWILAAVPLVWLRALSESGTIVAAAAQRPAGFVISGVRVLGNVLPTAATVVLLFLAIFALTQVFGPRRAGEIRPDA